MRFKINAQTFSHGWELPARLAGERGRNLPLTLVTSPARADNSWPSSRASTW
jgi:hypothetical protein